MSLYDIRDNNYIQPNRFFSVRGEVTYIEKESKFTKIILDVFSYLNIEGSMEPITIHFKGNTKKIVDGMVQPHHYMLVMGDIVFKAEKMFLDGKIIEIYKTSEIVRNDNAKFVTPDSANYDRSF